MSWRNVIISRRCKLDYKMGYLVIRGEDVKRIFLDEVAVIMLENPAVSLTGCLVEALTEKKIKVIFCDGKHNPVSELVPYHGSHDSSLKIKRQTSWTEECKAAVWQRITMEKIRNQMMFLSELGKVRERDLLGEYMTQVEPHDRTNREGHAAKVYFNALFGLRFSRGADTPINAALNYGYSILLASFNREIALNGYLTQLGIFHDNRFNHYNLSCDLMEPFRFLVDRTVYERMPSEFTKEEKHQLWQIFSQSVLFCQSRQIVLNAIKLYTKRTLDCLTNNTPSELAFIEQK